MTSGIRAAVVATFVAVALAVTQAQGVNDWSSVAKDPGGSKFSPLTQITPGNVSQLQTAWTYDLGVGGPYTVTPIVVSNVLYFPVGTNIIALQADTGKELWKSDLKAIAALGPNPSAGGRGISYWPGTPPAVAPRLVIATTNGFLVQLSAKTGKPIVGPAAVIDMGKGVMEKFGGTGYAINTPP